MKSISRLIFVIVIVVFGIAGLLFAYFEMRKEHNLEAATEAPVVAPSYVERSIEHGPVVKIDEETQKRLGVQTLLPAPGSVAKEVVATARVLDSSSLAILVSELLSARAALDAAQADYDRKQKLFEAGQNASASAVEQAKATAKQQLIAVESARYRIGATWGQIIARREDLRDLVRTLLEREKALVRVDLLPSDKLGSDYPEVRLLRHNGEQIATCHILDRAPTIDSPGIGQSFLCLVATNALDLVSGTVLVARLETGVKENGLIIPRNAIVRHAGLGWVYVQTSSETFTRRAIPLDRPHLEGWLANGEWTQPIVITGAQSLLSEESKGSIQMKD